jgi:glycosyltransferase involved in cell wall biosynthesis
MRIAIMAHRGIPANFGGSETAVEEIGQRLAEMGHEVIVYCRKHNSRTNTKMYKGMQRVVLPSINTTSTDMLSHTFLSIWNSSLFHKVDVIHFHGVGAALLFPMLKLLSHSRTILVVDGPDWNRPKWGWLARTMLLSSFPVAVRFADAIVSDNRPVQQLFLKQFGRKTEYITYGANTRPVESTGELDRQGLEPGRYLIQVAALVPDKGIHVLIEAYERLETDMPLVIVGDTPYATEYKTKLRATKDKRIRFLGYIYGERYRELVKHAYLYVHPLIVDGTSPALLQAMALGKCVISTDLPETMGVVEGAAMKFISEDVDNLRAKLRYALDNPDQVAKFGQLAYQRVEQRYNWDLVAQQYEALSYKVLQKPYNVALLSD